jgi:AcrR family transcriptional regulator
MRYASGMAADPALSRSARKTAATREAIVDAAQALLDDGGPAALTIPAVSERADVAVQTIYNRVGGRDALLLAVAERALEANRIYMDQAYTTPGTPLERIRRAALAYARFAAERPQQFRLIANPPDEPQALERIADLIQEQNNKLADALRDGIADGSIRPDIDPDLTATTLWAMSNAVLGLAWRNDRLRTDPNSAYPLAADIIERGLAPLR